MTIAALRVMMESLTKIRELANISPEEAEGIDGYVLQWKSDSVSDKLRNYDKSIKDAVEHDFEEQRKEFNEWVKENGTPEEIKLMDDAARVFIRYQLDTSNKEESMH